VLERKDHYPQELSGGEQQRIAFCRAVLNDPPLLLADEPTGNLDDANGAVIFDALRRRARAGAAVVVVSHRPEAAMGATAVYRLRVHLKADGENRTTITVERTVFRRERILWMDSDEPVATPDQAVEREVLAAIGRSF